MKRSSLRAQARRTFIMLVCLLALSLLGWMDEANAQASADMENSRVESAMELPRRFQGAELGMARGELLRTAGLSNKRSERDVIVVPGRDRYIKQVEYRFYNGALYSMQTLYRPERIPGGVEALVVRLKNTYGRPVVDGAVTFSPAPGVLSEKRIVWNDGRTEIAFLECERDVETGPEFALVMTDLRLEQKREEALIEQERRLIGDVPIPMPERDRSSRTAILRRDGNARATGHDS
jgi:hypothetical protein